MIFLMFVCVCADVPDAPAQAASKFKVFKDKVEDADRLVPVL